MNSLWPATFWVSGRQTFFASSFYTPKRLLPKVPMAILPRPSAHCGSLQLLLLCLLFVYHSCFRNAKQDVKGSILGVAAVVLCLPYVFPMCSLCFLHVFPNAFVFPKWETRCEGQHFGCCCGRVMFAMGLAWFCNGFGMVLQWVWQWLCLPFDYQLLLFAIICLPFAYHVLYISFRILIISYKFVVLCYCLHIIVHLFGSLS